MHLTPNCWQIEGEEHCQIEEDVVGHVDVDAQGVIPPDQKGYPEPQSYNGETANVSWFNNVNSTGDKSSQDQNAHQHIHPILYLVNHALELEYQQTNVPETNQSQHGTSNEEGYHELILFICQFNCLNYRYILDYFR